MSELTESLQGFGGLFLLEKGDRYSVSMRDANDIIGLAREACSALAAKDAEIEALKAELAATYEELIDHTGDDLNDTRARRVAALKGDAP